MGLIKLTDNVDPLAEALKYLQMSVAYMDQCAQQPLLEAKLTLTMAAVNWTNEAISKLMATVVVERIKNA